MITLHGFAYSNYYNIVKHVLLYKSIPFKEDKQYGGTDDYLELSAAGKIPALTTERGVHLSESSVCCDYLEEAYPVTPLYPANSIARAQVRQIMKISELYLELAARRLIPFIFTKTDVPAPLADDVRSTLERGVGALNRLCAFDPYVTGAELTMADIYLRYVMNVVDMAGAAKLDWDIGADINGLKDWQALMADSEISQQVDADREANRDEFFAYVQKRMAG
ncbi:MAG: glutathione S-transferase family protein [Pseudomonadales bacterium]|nr:glutathione S-transferase family protein [Gammaproteobacteria bacterium]NNL56355.1 glutathione S-transferase family protein [Pseudomonadales bacterium]